MKKKQKKRFSVQAHHQLLLEGSNVRLRAAWPEQFEPYGASVPGALWEEFAAVLNEDVTLGEWATTQRRRENEYIVTLMQEHDMKEQALADQFGIALATLSRYIQGISAWPDGMRGEALVYLQGIHREKERKEETIPEPEAFTGEPPEQELSVGKQGGFEPEEVTVNDAAMIAVSPGDDRPSPWTPVEDHQPKEQAAVVDENKESNKRAPRVQPQVPLASSVPHIRPDQIEIKHRSKVCVIPEYALRYLVIQAESRLLEEYGKLLRMEQLPKVRGMIANNRDLARSAQQILKLLYER
jgi:hypothetical protein